MVLHSLIVKSEINNTEAVQTLLWSLEFVIQIYLEHDTIAIEYSDNYSKISESSRQYYKDEPNNNLTDSESFKSKIKMT